jgi:hypothetical protein
MALGSKTLAAFCLTAAAYAADYPARHEHWRGSCAGTLTVTEAGIRFVSPKHSFEWKFDGIQNLDLSSKRLIVRTYKDNPWRGGTDQAYEFRGSFESVEPPLQGRIVNRIPDASVEADWILPVKLTGRWKGSEGDLAIGSKQIVYRTRDPNHSRTWEFDDIENVSTSNRYELTVATLERDFHFQLKQPLAESRYNELWLRLQRHKGLKLIGELQ